MRPCSTLKRDVNQLEEHILQIL